MNSRTLETADNWWRMPHDHVFVDERKLREDAYLAVARGEEFALPQSRKLGVRPESDEAYRRFIFWVNAINFNFSHPVVRDGKLLKYRVRGLFGGKESGYFAMCAALYRAFGEEPITSAHLKPHLKSLSRVKEFFKGYNQIPMVHERWMMLAEACGILDAYFGGDPDEIWRRGNYRAYGTLGIVDLLTGYFPNVFGADQYVLRYNSIPFYFHKRAHLLLMMYQWRAEEPGSELWPIEDIDQVGPMPDYELPRSYRADRIFTYSEELLQLVVAGKPLRRGSQMELEVRGATVWSQLTELAEINRARTARGLPPRHIGHSDFYRWRRGHSYTGEPPHVCFTTDY